MKLMVDKSKLLCYTVSVNKTKGEKHGRFKVCNTKKRRGKVGISC